MDIEHKECQLCGGSKLIITHWLILNLIFTDSIILKTVSRKVVFEEVSQFWVFGVKFWN